MKRIRKLWYFTSKDRTLLYKREWIALLISEVHQDWILALDLATLKPFVTLTCVSIDYLKAWLEWTSGKVGDKELETNRYNDIMIKFKEFSPK